MKNEYKVTWDLYKSWGQESAFKPPKLYMVISWCGIAAACLIMSVIFTAKGVMTLISSDGLLFMVLFAFSIYRAFFRNILISRKQYDALANRYQTRDWTRTILFNDDDIEIVEGGNSFKNDYARIKAIRENGDRIYLDLDDGMVIRLYKSAFVDCDWDECRNFIEANLYNTFSNP